MRSRRPLTTPRQSRSKVRAVLAAERAQPVAGMGCRANTGCFSPAQCRAAARCLAAGAVVGGEKGESA